MTGFAAAGAETAAGTLSIELRSVNSRFLDLQFRVSDELRALEPMLREMISARVTRGKLDCRAFLNQAEGARASGRINGEALARLQALAAEVARQVPQATALRVADILRWPGIIAQASMTEEETRQVAGALCRRALDEFVASREREGAKLAAAIGDRVAAMRARLEAVAPLVPQALAAYQAKLAERLREALGAAFGASGDERVRAELALFAAKVDVDEELTRLRTHFTEVERTLQKGGPIGKRLDFLAQELNREANTLASKAASQEIGDCALELKVLIEQMREQVQNIE